MNGRGGARQNDRGAAKRGRPHQRRGARDVTRRATVTLSFALALLAAGRAAAPDTARAAGFALYEQGAAAMGRAGAFVAGADDPSALFYNPAALAGLAGTRVMLSPSAIVYGESFDGSAPFPGDGTSWRTNTGLSLVPAGYVSHALGPRATIAAGLSAPFGLETDWSSDPGFAGRFLSHRARLERLDASLGAGAAATRALDLGGSISLTESRVLLQRAIAAPYGGLDQTLEVGSVLYQAGRSPGWAWSAGARLRTSDRSRVAVCVRGASVTDLSGPAAFRILSFSTGIPEQDSLLRSLLPQDQSARVRLHYPLTAVAGVETRLGTGGTLELDLGWTRWSTFDTLALRFSADSSLDIEEPQQFHDALAARLGLSWRAGAWTLRAGAYFDATPQPAATLSPVLADASRAGLSFGAGRGLGPLRADAYVLGLLIPSRATDGGSLSHLDGRYQLRAGTAGVSLTWRH